MGLTGKLFYFAAAVFNLAVASATAAAAVITDYRILMPGALAALTVSLVHIINGISLKFKVNGRKLRIKNAVITALFLCSAVSSVIITAVFAAEIRYVEYVIYIFIIAFLTSNVFLSVTYSLFCRGLILFSDKTASLAGLVNSLCVLSACCAVIDGGKGTAVLIFLVPPCVMIVQAFKMAVREQRIAKGGGFNELNEMRLYNIVSEEYGLTVERLIVSPGSDGGIYADVELSEKLDSADSVLLESELEKRLTDAISCLKDVRVRFR